MQWKRKTTIVVASAMATLGLTTAGVMLEIGSAAATTTIGSPSSTLTPPGFSSANASVFDSSGDLWISTPDNTVVEFTQSQLAAGGSPAPAVVLSGRSNLAGLGFDSSGDLWLLDDWSSSSGEAAEFTPTQIASSGSPTPVVTLSGLSAPSHIAFDASGNMWITNGWANQVVEFSASQLTTSGAPTPAVVLSNSTTSGEGSVSGDIDNPFGLGFDSSGDLWVSNGWNKEVLEFTPGQLTASGNPTPALTLTSPDFDNAGSGPGDGTVAGLAFDPLGDLWLLNGPNGVIDEFTPSQLTAGGSQNATVQVDTAVNLSSPAFDPSGNLWIGNGSAIDGYAATALGTAPSTPTLSSNPLQFGPYTTANDPDSGNCGNPWADDDYTRTFNVSPNADGSFTVTELVKGTFTTVAGAVQPNPSSGCSGSPATETGGVTGPMYGEFVITVPTGADFNPYASFTLDSSQNMVAGTQSWIDTFFDNVTGGTTPGSDSSPLSGLTYAWEFYYHTSSNGSWADTDHGSSTGNITG